MRRLFFLLLLLPWPLAAQQPPTMAELDALYEGLVREEAAVLEQRERVQRNIENTDLILMVESGGQITGMTREELRAYFGSLVARLTTLGITEAYLSRLSFWKRSAAQVLIDNNMLPDIAIGRLERSSTVLRALEREKLPLIEEDLAQIRAKAAEIQRQREELRAWVARGDGSGFETIPDLTTCRNPDIPADYDVSEATVGYGGSGGYKAKGNYICIWADGFLYMEGNTTTRYTCNRQTGLDCVADENSRREWTAFDDPDPNVIFAYSSGASSLRFYPPTP